METANNTIKILVVEDNKINQIVINNLIQKNGWICTIAQNGRKAIEILEVEKYDVIFMDMFMPVMGGIEATNIIRKNKLLKDIPIIALTACSLKNNKEKLLNIGMNDCLSKPIKDEELYYMVIKHLHLLEFNGDEKKKKEYFDAFKNLEKLVAGDKKLVIELSEKLVQLFSNDRAQEVLNLIELKSFQEVRDLLHMLKGALSNFQLKSIQRFLEELIFCVNENDKEQVVIILKNIGIKMKEFEEFLNIYEKEAKIWRKIKEKHVAIR